jgi:3-oxoacyl-[acyl-carrier-protein] synthase II
LTVPNGAAQQEVIRAALADAAVEPAEVGFVETHGTGTALGDPIEVQALDAVLGTGAGTRPAKLAIGNVKTRIGHLEAAAGIAGIIKLVLALRKGVIPASLRASDAALSPMIAWDRMPIEVPRADMAWPREFGRPVAGISAFGLSGTNAHAIFEGPPAIEEEAPHTGDSELVTISARDEQALAKLSAATAARLRAAGDAGLASIARTLRTGRAAFACRRSVIGRSAAEIAAALEGPGRAGVPGGVPMRVQLRTGTNDPGLVEALVAAFPMLADAEGADATTRLHMMIRRLVPGARLTREGAESDASLEWGMMRMPLSTGEARLSLFAAIARLFEDGADLRLDALSRPGTTICPDVPTYPFRRERFWLEEPRLQAAHGSVSAEAVDMPSGRTGEVARFVETELLSLLRADEALDHDATFLDAGGDSFIAVLLKKAVEQRYAIDLPSDLLDTTLPLSALFARIEGFVLEPAFVQAAE